MNIFNNVNTIYLMLGDNCNLACRYCIQGNNTEQPKILPKDINPSIYRFIKELSSKNRSLCLLFYGGEPLLYLDKIKEIIKNTENSHIHYMIITNGLLLTEDIINYFNSKQVDLIVSWDGLRSINTRHYDVFSSEEHKQLIFKSNILGINSVISSMNYPLEATEDIQTLANEYYSVNPNGNFRVNFDEIIDNHLYDKSLLQMDYNKVQSDTEQILKDCKKYLTNKASVSNEEFKTKLKVKYSYLERYLWTIANYLKNKDNYINLSPCRDGLERLGMDLNGNLYSCHDSREIIGNVINLDLVTYISNYLKYDNSKELYETFCKDCKYWSLCLGRCKLLTKEARLNHTCKLKKAVGEPILNFLDKLK